MPGNFSHVTSTSEKCPIENLREKDALISKPLGMQLGNGYI